ncbi:SufD family Fe-S cluster assembly protein [Patescibacteria group bacterium]
MKNAQVKIEQSAEGAALTVPAGFQTKQCIQMPEMAADQRWNAVVEKGARAVLCERDIHNSEIIVEAGAQLELVSMQIDEPTNKHPVSKKIILHDRAVVRLFTGLFNAVDVTMLGELDGNSCVFENHVMYFGSKKQTLRMQLNTKHSGQRTMSRNLVRGVAVEQAHADFAGMIQVEPSARLADAYLKHEGLLLSEKARIDALPSLKIATNDVKPTHSSAVHFIQPEQVFYLQSRGLDAVAAKQLIVSGFLEEMLATVREPDILKQIHQLIEDKQKLITE